MNELRILKRKQVRERDHDDRILPLINIVFLLLIFFMVVGRLSAADPFELTPIHSASDEAPSVQSWLVQVGPRGQLALNGLVLTEPDLLEQLEAAAGSREALDVRIKSDNRAEATLVVALLAKLRSVGVVQAQLLTVQTAN